jgi:hypothetical protein
MNNLTACNECTAIAQELREAYADAWDSSAQTSKDAWVATYEMIGGTEDDATRAEQLVREAHIPNAPRIKQALLKKFAHEARSGHKVPWVA